MANEIRYYSSFDDLVFEHRNKEYGAYDIRKKYGKTVFISLLAGIIIFTSAAVIISVRAKNRIQHKEVAAREVIAEIALDLKQDALPLPPPPPPEEKQAPEEQSVVKYIAPEVVDTIRPEDQTVLATPDEQVESVTGKEIIGSGTGIGGNAPEEDSKDVYGIVEEMPQFPGGEMALVRFIMGAINYPVAAQKNGIQGKVYVSFIVDKDGRITEAKIQQGVNPLLDKEALRVVRSLPRWKPGKQHGIPVRVSYTVPINFML